MRGRGRGRGAGRVLLRAGAVTVLVVGLVGACTGGGEPVATPTPTPSPTATPVPTPTPMAFPTPAAAISEPTPEGAIAAGTQFVALYDYAFSSGDVKPLMAMAGAECEYCTRVEQRVQQMVDGGYSTEGEPMRVLASDSTEIREDEWFRVHLRVEQGPVVTVASDGRRQQTSDGGTVEYIFAISWVSDRWRVEAVSIELAPQ